MIKAVRPLPIFCFALLILVNGLLSACAPTTAGTSASTNSELAQLYKQQSEKLAQLQEQLAQLQRAMNLTPETLPPVEPVETEMIPVTIRQEVTDLADSASSYLAAFSDLAAGRYALAETGFSSFLERFPDHQYASNARYWLASAQLSQQKLQPATTNLRQVIISGGDRAPAALALLAKTYRQQQMYEQAEDILDQLRTRYPNSSEAQQFMTDTGPQ